MHDTHAARLDHLDRVAHTMDRALRIPLIGVRVGLDSIIGLVPGVGDLLALGPAGYIVLQAHRMGAPRGLVARMGVNIGIDAVVGSIPLIGDLFDVGWKANSRNVKLLREHFGAQSVPLTS